MTNPYPNRFRESPNQFWDCFFSVFFSHAQDFLHSPKIETTDSGSPRTNSGIAFFRFFSVTHKISFTRQKLRQYQRHGAPILTNNLGNQHTLRPQTKNSANKRRGGFSSHRRLKVLCVVQPVAQPPHLSETTTRQQLEQSPFLITLFNLTTPIPN